MPHTTSNFQTWKPEIDTYMQEEQDIQKGITPQYETLFSVSTTDRLQLTDTGFSGFSPMVEVGETGEAVKDRVIEGYTSLYQRRFFRKQADFSAAVMQTDQTGKVEDMAKGLVSVVPYSRNLNIFSMIRNMANALYLWGDGKTLVSIAHPLKNGQGTQPNTFVDGIQRPLSYESVKLLEDVLISNVSNSGNMLQLGGKRRRKVIWGSEYLRADLFKIADVAGTKGQPDTDSNNSNYFTQGTKYDVLILDFVNYEAARQAGETTVAKSSDSNFWDKMWGICDIDCVKKYFKVKIATGYSKFDEEINKKNEVLIKYAYDSYMFGNSGYLGFAASKGDSSILAI